MIAGGIVVALVGLLVAAFPRAGWQMSRWQYRSHEAVEPSDAYFSVTRIAGVVIVAVGVFALIVPGVRASSANGNGAHAPGGKQYRNTVEAARKVDTLVRRLATTGHTTPRR